MIQEATLDRQRAEYRLFGETFKDVAFPSEKDYLAFRKPYSKDLLRKVFQCLESQENLLITFINDSYEEKFACRVGFIEYSNETIYAAILVVGGNPEC